MKLLLRLLVTALSLWVATRFVDGISFRGDNYAALLGVALVFGVVNTIVRPILKLFSFPVVLLTLGLFLFVINGLMLLLTSWLSARLGFGFHVAGIIPAIIGSLVVSITAAVLHFVLGTNRDDD
ncbi:MAG TPA: phage holin family protein [Gemmatimonadaceae bacterium]|nr:phage holin family protein [Gemmatimonadaceae bacterium]